MKDQRLTNALLAILILLVAANFFQPAFDGASTAQAQMGGSNQEPKIVSTGETAIASATSEVAKSNSQIASALKEVAAANKEIASALSDMGSKLEAAINNYAAQAAAGN